MHQIAVGAHANRLRIGSQYDDLVSLEYFVLGARCGESRSPAFSPGSMEPRREALLAIVMSFTRA